ncbi:MAG: Anaerobic nitric oxide reductase flavorubredoxin [Candidatus Thorarchaeota archaeon]|nr:MAG: Anaerobic nitric oxide reductase flavorubredoxin [Candidatus Thorarchaeota archaeon]
MHVLVIYESTRGRTKAMAEAICKGVLEAGKKCKLITPNKFTGLENACAIAIGSSTRMKRPLPGVRSLLDEIEIEEGFAVYSFGSYGWSGEAPDEILDKLMERGGIAAIEKPLKVKDHPSDEDIVRCRETGRKLSELCVK